LSSAVYHLLENRDQWEALVADPALANGAVEEILRFETPARQLQPKFLGADLEIQGVTIPKGHRIVPFLGAAHRDPAVFADPDRFDITRNAKLQLGFGLGRHFCIGASFARVEGQEFLRAFPQLLPNIYIDGPVEWDPSIMLRGLRSMPIRVGR
jgi:cytochrome P450